MAHLNAGQILILLSFVLLVIGIYGIILSDVVPKTGVWIWDLLAEDRHYKYWAALLIPTTTYFVIANWVGWQYYQNS